MEGVKKTKESIGRWMDLSYKVTYYKNLIRAIIFLVFGIIFFGISILFFLSSFKVGLVLLIFSLIFFGLMWLNKKGANSAKKANEYLKKIY